MIFSNLFTFLIFLNNYSTCYHQVSKKIRTRRIVKPTRLTNELAKDKFGVNFIVNSLLSLYDFEGDTDLFATRKNVFGVSLVIVLNTGIFILVIWQSSRLFSKGLSKKFMNGGGWWLILSAFLGNLFGSFIGYFMNYSVLIFGFSFMLLAVSVLLLGRRGMIIGAISGLEIGSIFGTIHSGSISAIITESMLCCFAGIAIGFIPLFPNIKINSRYIQKSLRYYYLINI